MGLEVLLILSGLIMQASTEHGEKLNHLGHTFVTVGIVILVTELVIAALIVLAGVVGIRKF